MASQSNNEQKHSTLQLFIHDQGANAPELYRETGAIELDSTATTPQVYTILYQEPFALFC